MKKLSICALTAALTLFQFQSAHAKAARAGSPTLERIAYWDVAKGTAPFFPDQGALSNLGATARLGLAMSLMGEGSSSTSSSSSTTPYKSLICYPDGSDPEVYSNTSQILIGTANSDTSSVTSSSTSSSGFSTTPITYTGTTEFGANRVRIRRYLPGTQTWQIEQSIEDSNLFPTPFSNWQEPFSISTSAQGPQVIVAWFNTLLNVVRTLFYDGTAWTQRDFLTTDPVRSLHTSVSIDGRNALLGFITQPDSATLVANSALNTGGDWLAATPVTSGVYDPECSPRIRVGAGRTHHFLGFNSGQREMTMNSSPDGLIWSQLGETLIADFFNFALSGAGNSGHLILGSTTDSGTNVDGRYYRTSPFGTHLVSASEPPLNINFISNLILKGLSLGFNSVGHLMTGVFGDGTNILQTVFSGLASTFLQPAKTGDVFNSLPGIFAPTGIGLGTPNYAHNDLSNPLETFASALNINTPTTASIISSYVSPPSLNNAKHHVLITEFNNDAGECINRIELLRGLSTTDSLGRFTQFSTSISQKGGTFSP